MVQDEMSHADALFIIKHHKKWEKGSQKHAKLNPELVIKAQQILDKHHE
jgi:hypothetical protein